MDNETSRLFRALRGLWTGHRGRGEIHKAREYADVLLGIARRSGSRSLLLEAHHTQWTTLYSIGDWQAVCDHATRGLTLNGPEHFTEAYLYSGHDSAVCGAAKLGVSLWMLGYPDQALVRTRASTAMARQLSHLPSLMHALFYATIHYHFRGDLAAAREGTEIRLQLAHERIPSEIETVGMQMGLLSALEDRRQARAGMADLVRALPTELSRDIEWRAYIRCLFAEVCKLAGESNT
ncbi:hypothetical protein AB4144_37450, partial [Rhizobiaceae sp. 2RAB30]